MSMRSAPPGAAHGSSAFSHLEHKSSLQHMHTIRPTWSRMGSDFTLLQIQMKNQNFNYFIRRTMVVPGYVIPVAWLSFLVFQSTAAR